MIIEVILILASVFICLRWTWPNLAIFLAESSTEFRRMNKMEKFITAWSMKREASDILVLASLILIVLVSVVSYILLGYISIQTILIPETFMLAIGAVITHYTLQVG